jgi:hypothetical protein
MKHFDKETEQNTRPAEVAMKVLGNRPDKPGGGVSGLSVLRRAPPVLTSIEAPRTGLPFFASRPAAVPAISLDPDSLQMMGLLADSRAGRVLTAEQHTKLLTALSAWFTMAKMEQAGTTFDEFIELATSNDPISRMRGNVIWGQLTTRLAEGAAHALDDWPEAMLSPEMRSLVEALVAKKPGSP